MESLPLDLVQKIFSSEPLYFFEASFSLEWNDKKPYKYFINTDRGATLPPELDAIDDFLLEKRGWKLICEWDRSSTYEADRIEITKGRWRNKGRRAIQFQSDEKLPIPLVRSVLVAEQSIVVRMALHRIDRKRYRSLNTRFSRQKKRKTGKRKKSRLRKLTRRRRLGV